ncbi:MAG: hypothetical protein FJX76_20530, partial [Armatimonadetes bacterium]|nr:hypothetical protein [Armatimonadota bacterium]
MPGPGLRPVAADATPDRFVAGGVATPAIQDPRVFKSIPSESDVALLEKLERKGYQPCESPENPLEVADFLARVGQGPLLLEHSDGNVEINSLGDLQPLHYFFGDSDVAPDADAAAFRALEKEGFDFKTDEGALDTYHAWRLFQDKADTTLLLKGDYRRGEHSVRGMDGVRLAGYVLADGPVPARADRAESLKRLQAEHCKVQDLQAAYEGAAPIPIIHDDVELVVLQPAALDRPDALLHDVKKQRDTFKAIKDAVRYGQSEEAWRCARTDIPGVSFDDRVEAVKLLGKAAKYNDHVENLFTLVKERRPSGVAFVDAARDLAGFVERVGADEGGKAWIRLHEDILPHRPRDLDDAATRAAFDALLEAGGSAEVAGRMWDALLDAKVPEPLVERFGAVKTLHDELRLDGDDCEEALKAVLELRRPSETLVGAVADLCAVARIVDERGALVDAFRTLRGPLSGPDDIPHEQRQTRLRALLDGTGKMSEATQAYEVVAQARDAAAFARRADAMEAVVKVTKSREWRGREAVEVFKAIETYGGWDGATAAALVRLLPLGGTVEAAVNLREALLRTVSEKGYDAAERALQAIAAVGPQDRDRGERALSDYRFLFRR